MRCPRMGVFVSLQLVGGPESLRSVNRLIPELDFEWKTAPPERLLYLTVRASQFTGTDTTTGETHDYAIIGRAQSGEILAVAVEP